MTAHRTDTDPEVNQKTPALAYPAEPVPAHGAEAIWRFVITHPYTMTSVIVLAAMGIAAVLKKNSEWVETYLGAAKALLAGTDFYHDKLKFTYPPFSAWLMLPFTFIPLRLGRLIWYSICVASLIYMIKTAWRLAGGKPIEPLGSERAAGPRDQIAFVIGHVIALQLTLNGITHLQTDVPIAAMLMAGIVAIVAGRYFKAASWIGLAAAFKATPLLFAPYLVWRRQYAAAAWLVFVAIAANLLPNTVHSPPGGGVWLVRWCQQFVEPMVSPKYVPGDWQNKLDNNQALAGAASRWLNTTWDSAENEADMVKPSRGRTLAIRSFFIGSCLVVTLPVVWVFWRRRKLAADGVPSPSPVILECGMVMLLMVLLSPNSSRAHFCVMYLAAFCVARVAVRANASAWTRILLAAAAIFSTLSIHVRLPGSKNAEQILLWIGVVMLATIFLLFAAVVTLMQNRNSSQTENALTSLEPRA